MQQVESLPQGNPQYRADDEIDLIDLIGFLWRIRKFVITGVVLGAAAGVGFSVLNRQAAEDPQKQVLTYRIPLVEDEGQSPQTSSLKVEERLTLLNEMLRSPDTAKAFVTSLEKSGVKLLPATEKTAPTAWFISQQIADNNAQKLAKLASWGGGGLVFTGTWMTQSSPETVGSIVVGALNKMIETYNKQVAANFEARKAGQKKRSEDLILTQTKIAATLFRLAGRLGPLSKTDELLMTSPVGSAITQGTESLDLDRATRILGLLEFQGRLKPEEAREERGHLAALREEVLEQGAASNDPTGKVVLSGASPRLLYELTLPPDSPELEATPTAEVATTGPGVRPGLAKGPAVMAVLGLLLGGFLGTVLGGLTHFLKTNWPRLKATIAS